jgi:hypothetical protein
MGFQSEIARQAGDEPAMPIEPPQGVGTDRAPRWRQKRAKAVLFGLVAAIVVTGGAAALLARWNYVPPEAMKISRSFVDCIRMGDLRGAYLLTNQGVSVGTTLAAFEGNIRQQLRIDAFPVHRSVELIGTRGGAQSYGNRLRRWIMGRKVDPDQVIVDYFFGPPFEIRLASDERGTWQITLFQSHAM